jgi:hypothetical protein
MSSTNIDIDLRVEEAVRYFGNNPTARQRAVTKKFNVPRDRVRRRLSGVPLKQGRHASNAWLTGPEEVALCRYVDRLDGTNLSIRKEFIKDAANLILRERTEETPQPTVGPKWVDRFIKRHNYSVLSQKIRDSSRQNAESVEKVTAYFERLHDCICEHGIVDSDILNMDETGFRIGVGKSRMVVTKRSRASPAVQGKARVTRRHSLIGEREYFKGGNHSTQSTKCFSCVELTWSTRHRRVVDKGNCYTGLTFWLHGPDSYTGLTFTTSDWSQEFPLTHRGFCRLHPKYQRVHPLDCLFWLLK